MNNISRAISHEGSVIMIAIDSTSIVSDMEKLHKTSATASAALGRTLTAASLMGSLLKNEDDSVTIQVRGNGPIGIITAVADSYGNVKGRCENPLADLPINKDKGKLDVGGLVGKDGTLVIIKDLGLKEPYIGQIPLVNGEIAEDITAYYAYSEQIPTVCSLGVLVDKDLSIIAAGGFLLQLLPGATEEEISLIEKNISSIDTISSMIEKGLTPKEIIDIVMEGFNPEILDEFNASYYCDCNDNRMKEILLTLGKEQLDEAVLEDGFIEIVCGYCNKKYRYTLEELR